LKLPMPTAISKSLGVARGAAANVMIRFEAVCLEETPDLIVVVGDVNSTMAAALVARSC